jgi:sulfite reductase alpha subunit-like flavoprotein
MAPDVEAALVSVAQQHGGLSAEGAAEYIQRMAADRRYVRDVY